MTDDGVDRDKQTPNGPRAAGRASADRPVVVTFVVAIVLAFAAGILSAAAPETFESLGGWVTVVVAIVVVVVVGTTFMLMGLNRGRRPKDLAPKSSDS